MMFDAVPFDPVEFEKSRMALPWPFCWQWRIRVADGCVVPVAPIVKEVIAGASGANQRAAKLTTTGFGLSPAGRTNKYPQMEWANVSDHAILKRGPFDSHVVPYSRISSRAREYHIRRIVRVNPAPAFAPLAYGVPDSGDSVTCGTVGR